MANHNKLSPKYWNTQLTEADENVYTDYEDEGMTIPTCVKLKTNRIKQWQNTIKRLYTGSCTEKSIGSDSYQHNIYTAHGRFSVNYYFTTGVVMVQGSPTKLSLFVSEILPPIQMSLPKKSTNQKTQEPSALEKTLNDLEKSFDHSISELDKSLHDLNMQTELDSLTADTNVPECSNKVPPEATSPLLNENSEPQTVESDVTDLKSVHTDPEQIPSSTSTEQTILKGTYDSVSSPTSETVNQSIPTSTEAVNQFNSKPYASDSAIAMESIEKSLIDYLENMASQKASDTIINLNVELKNTKKELEIANRTIHVQKLENKRLLEQIQTLEQSTESLKSEKSKSGDCDHIDIIKSLQSELLVKNEELTHKSRTFEMETAHLRKQIDLQSKEISSLSNIVDNKRSLIEKLEDSVNAASVKYYTSITEQVENTSRVINGITDQVRESTSKAIHNINDQVQNASKSINNMVDTFNSKRHYTASQDVTSDHSECTENNASWEKANKRSPPNSNKITDNKTYYTTQGGADILSNFYSEPLSFENKTYKSAEHAYFSTMLFESSEKDAEQIEKCRAPNLAKREGEKLMEKEVHRLKWPNGRRRSLMKRILVSKYKSSPRFREKLKSTKSSKILHSVKDKYWGIGINTGDIQHPFDFSSIRGENQHGKILEEIREEYGGVETYLETSNTDTKHVKPKKKLVIMGNSLIEPLSEDRIDPECDVSKITCMTIKDASKEVESLSNYDIKPDIVYFQLMTNDLQSNTPSNCVSDMQSLCEKMSEICPTTKIIVAEAPLTAHSDLNHRIGAVNNLIHIELPSNVTISSSGNLGQHNSIREYLRNDDTGKHLNYKGTGQLVRNLKACLAKVKQSIQVS